MAQIFHRSANQIAKGSIILGVLAVGVLTYVVAGVQLSSYITDAGVVQEQPVPFSHEHHVRGLGIDCRYCHTSAEKSSFAGVPPTKTCMTCHSQVWTNAELLAPVRSSWASGKPIEWVRVNNLPNFVYFNHSIHVAKGVGCTTCHGQVDRMPLTWRHATLQMKWCLECHRDPAAFVRPRDEVFNMDWTPPADQHAQGEKLVAEYGIRTRQLTNCSVCHR